MYAELPCILQNVSLTIPAAEGQSLTTDEDIFGRQGNPAPPLEALQFFRVDIHTHTHIYTLIYYAE